MASSTSPHLCLRWNNYQSNLTNVFDQLLQNETFVDVTLAADGHAIKAHKMVLSACSPYFQALFFDNPCQHPIVILKDTRWSELKAVVEYMYRGEISVAQEELNSLLRVAETLKIRGLSELNGDRDRELHRDKMSTEEDSTSHAGSPPILGAGLVTERAGSDLRSAGAPNSLQASTCSSGGSTGAGGGVAPGLLSAASLNGRKTDSPSSSCPLSSTNTPWGNHLISSGGAGMEDTPTPSASPALRHKRRRYSLGEGSTPPGPGSPEGSSPPTTTLHANTSGAEDSGSLDGPLPLLGHAHPSPASSSAPSSQGFGPVSAGAPLSSTPHVADELDIKPGIAELIREEERARMLEGTHPWLAASPSVLSVSRGGGPTDSYQYQLQALWQKAWATGQGVVQNLRFRERGPFKTWRPETMAEAIMAVLREGLSLSQAARKFDIPYPTFVLYANRVNNMLGPSADGSASVHLELRPKGRGRPQRILTGSWPEDHVHGVIRAVVFRDTSSLRDESLLKTSRVRPSHMGPESVGRSLSANPMPVPTSEFAAAAAAAVHAGGVVPHSSNGNGNNLPNHLSHNNNFTMGPNPMMMSLNRCSANGVDIVTTSNNHGSHASQQQQQQQAQHQQQQQHPQGQSALQGPGGNLLNQVGMAGPSSASSSSASSNSSASNAFFNAMTGGGTDLSSEEARLAALSAMTQRILGAGVGALGLDAESLGMGVLGGGTSGGGGGGGAGVATPNNMGYSQRAENVWYGGMQTSYGGGGLEDGAQGLGEDVDVDPHMANSFLANNAVNIKQEQLFGD